MTKAVFEPLEPLPSYSSDEQIERSRAFFEKMAKRRTIRDFSSKAVPREVIENAILAAGRAPSGANKQPWHFVAISNNDLKSKLRPEAEKEEEEFYQGRAGEKWLEDLTPFGTDANKPFLEIAPWLIAVFRQPYGIDPESGEKLTHYYVHESVGIASGILLTALHDAGLATLTHTPSPMGFLNELCGRPKSEKPIMLIVTGFPADGAEVPKITKKPLGEIATFLE